MTQTQFPASETLYNKQCNEMLILTISHASSRRYILLKWLHINGSDLFEMQQDVLVAAWIPYSWRCVQGSLISLK